MGRISSCSQGEVSVCFGNLRIISLPLADDVALLALSVGDLQQHWGSWNENQLFYQIVVKRELSRKVGRPEALHLPAYHTF